VILHQGEKPTLVYRLIGKELNKSDLSTKSTKKTIFFAQQDISLNHLVLFVSLKSA
jgi:hypothetical protein